MFSVLLSVAALLCGIGILVVGSSLMFTILGLRATAEQFSDAIIGLVMSGYFMGFIAGTYFCPRLISRVGHVRAFAAMAAVASATGVLHALIVQPLMWLIFRFITGVCLVGIYLVVESWLNEKIKDRNRGLVFASYQAVLFTAMMAAQYLILIGDPYSATPLMLATALLALGLVPVALTRVEEPAAVMVPAIRLGELFRISPVGVTGVLTAAFTNGIFFSLAAVFSKRIGLSEAELATFISATILGGAVLQVPIGHLSDNRDRRKIIFLVCLTAAVLAAVAWFVTDRSVSVLTAVMFLYGGAAFSLYSLSVAYANDRKHPGKMLEIARGVLLVYGLGSTAGPLITGFVMELAGAGSFLGMLAAAQTIYCIFILYRMLKRGPLPVAAQEEFIPMSRTSEVALEMLDELHPPGPEKK